MMVVDQYNEMTGPELVKEYNKMVRSLPGSGLRPVIKFADRYTGAKRCRALAETLAENARREVNVITTVVADTRSGTEPAAKPAVKPAGKLAARGAMLIKPLKEGNPKREGSDGARYYDAMVRTKTVGAYLGEYPAGKPRRTANQWMGNFVREGFIKLVKNGG